MPLHFILFLFYFELWCPETGWWQVLHRCCFKMPVLSVGHTPQLFCRRIHPTLLSHLGSNSDRDWRLSLYIRLKILALTNTLLFPRMVEYKHNSHSQWMANRKSCSLLSNDIASVIGINTSYENHVSIFCVF